ncbi:hypothetical protein HYW35_04270 [Candidatus Saccharibacteria bacterium]|nr:hypothetical protein [Candidatus Saccharibacteria bacterium]
MTLTHKKVIILVSKLTSIVNVNGQRYNAVTGQLIGAVKKAATRVKNPVAGFSVDGFTSKSTTPKARSRRSVSHIHRQPAGTKTLMRRIVKRPTANGLKAASSVKDRTQTPNYARAFRAKLIPKSDKVRHFGLLSSKAQNPNKKLSPKAAVGEVIAHKFSQRDKTSNSSMTSAMPMPNTLGVTSHQQLERLLDYALHRADAHKQAAKRSARRPWQRINILPKWLNISIAVLIVASLGGFLIWSNVPQVPLKVASSIAHVEAAMPTYTPSGYSYGGHIAVKEGAVTIPYKDTTNAAKVYTVTQKASNMDSSSLANTALPKNTPTQTLDSSGRAPVFGYTDNNNSVATCVSGGVQTIVSGNLDPSSAQKVASSLCQ